VPQVADNGRVVFASQAGNLTPGDTNGVSDLFLWDPETEVVTNVTGHASVGTWGKPGTFDINPVGDFVAVSTAARLVAEDTDDLPDVYRWEVAAGRDGLRLVESSTGAYSPRMSDDGRRIVFEAARLEGGTFRWTTRLVEMGSMAQGPVAVRANGHGSDADTAGPVISGDGRAVVYATSDDDLAGRPLRGASQLLLQRFGH
jgi:Tol biopolymer transport system component